MGQTKPLASGGVPHSAGAAESTNNASTHPLSPKTTGSATDTQPKVDPSTSSDTSNIPQTEQHSEGVNPAEGKKPTDGSHIPLNDDDPTKEGDPNKPPSGDSQETKNDPKQVSILQNRPFIILTVEHDGTDGGRVTGSILSQSLDKISATTPPSDIGNLTLAGLRKLVPHMSRFASLQRFCTPSGTLIDDEAITLTEYLALEEDPGAPTSRAGTPSVRIHFSANKLGKFNGKSGAGTEVASHEAPNFSEGPSVKAPPFADTGVLLQKSPDTGSLIDQEANDVGADVKSAGNLHEDEWAVVLRNCAIFYGWVVDPISQRIIRAPKPAFRLRSQRDQGQIAKIPDFASKEAPRHSTEADAGRELSDQSPGSTNGTPSVEVDAAEIIIPRPDKGIPNFQVNDDSKIEISAHKDEISVSMAKSDFSDESTEASVSGGGFGVSVGVSAGLSSSKFKSSKNLNSVTTQTMIARYMFPRCDLVLWPDELQLTEELSDLIEQIRTSKDIKVLRKLQVEYGQLFCQQVTLGGRLLSTKALSSDEQKSIEETKESFKNSVGASVSGGFGGFSAGVSVKHDQAHGASNASEKDSRSQNEAVIFEAVGGDTILANNPSKWCATVGDYNNWRIINRGGLSTLPEMIAAIPGYEAVQSWFVQAVPAFSQYMRLDEAHECQVRLKVTTPTNSLSIRNAGNDACFYLGHDAAETVTPRLNNVNPRVANLFWIRLDVSDEIPIFNPPTYRAPTIFGYEGFNVEKTPYGAAYNPGFVKTEWTIIAPFEDELVHGTRVILKTTPFIDDTVKLLADAGTATPNVSHMIVFRNFQGEFLPGMSDSDEYQYWRIIKTDPSQPHIKPGDEVRLIWDFQDQITGWRDFTQDVFGRRQVSPPTSTDGSAAIKGPLFLKVPWPRFEVSSKPTALILSHDSGDLSAKSIKINNNGTSQTFDYCLQDLKFRMDSVNHNGRGDAEDYMMNKLTMEGVNVTVKLLGQTLQMHSDIFWFGQQKPSAS